MSKQDEFLQILESSTSLRNACDKAGITRDQFIEWMLDLSFARRVSKMEVGARLAVEDALFIKAMQGNTTAIKLFLQREGEESYIDRQLRIIREQYQRYK